MIYEGFEGTSTFTGGALAYDQHYTGLFSLKITQGNTAYLNFTASTESVISFAQYRTSDKSFKMKLTGTVALAKILYLTGDGTYSVNGVDTGVACILNSWVVFVAMNINYTTHAFDFYINGARVGTFTMYDDGSGNYPTDINQISFGDNTGDIWIDEIIIGSVATSVYSDMIPYLNANWDLVTYPGVYFTAENVWRSSIDQAREISCKYQKISIRLDHPIAAAQDHLMTILRSMTTLFHTAIPRMISAWPFENTLISRFEVDIIQ